MPRPAIYDTVTLTAGRILSRRSRSRSKADRHLAIRSRTQPGRQPSIFNAVTDGHGFTAFTEAFIIRHSLYRLSHAVATVSRQSKATKKSDLLHSVYIMGGGMPTCTCAYQGYDSTCTFMQQAGVIVDSRDFLSFTPLPMTMVMQQSRPGVF